jgi:CubicO group peptidase (beta-lactamase class C family)
MDIDRRRWCRLLRGSVLAAGLLGASPLLADEQPIDVSRIDAWVEQRMQAEKIPGVALAVVRGGRVAYSRGYGIADPEGRPATPQTPFLIGSVTKSFTALAVAQLAEAGAIRLDDPVQQHLPWFRLADEQAAATITIRQLLTHTSGLSTLDGNRHRLARSQDDDALPGRVRMLDSVRPSAAPGEGFQYSNANYQILGALIESVSGQSFEDHVTERIFRPLGMGAGFASTPEGTPRDVAVGHRYWFGQPVPTGILEHDRHVLAQALVVASAEDLARYVLFHLGHAPASSAGMLSPAGLREAQDTGAFRYGFGLQGGERNGARVVGHGGQNPGFFAFMLFSTERDEGVVVLANAADFLGGAGAGGILLGILDLLAGVEPRLPAGDPLVLIALSTLAGVVALLVGSVLLTRRRLRQWRSATRPLPAGRAPRLLRLVPTALLFAAAAWVLLVEVWHQLGAPIGAALLFAPDVAWLMIIVGSAAIAWGVVRTVLLLHAFAHAGGRRDADVTRLAAARS